MKKGLGGLGMATAMTLALAAGMPGTAHADTAPNDIKIGNRSQFVQSAGATAARPQTLAFRPGRFVTNNNGGGGRR